MTDKKDRKQDEQGPEQRLTGMLRLVVDSRSATGRKPDLEEIQSWHLGRLSEPRASEVKSHVARDPECFQLWSELVAAEQQTQSIADTAVPAQSTDGLWYRFKRWWKTPLQAWASGTVATAALVLFVIVMLPQSATWSPLQDPVRAELTYDWPYESMSLTRGGDLVYRDKIALQSGLRQAIAVTTTGIEHWQMVVKRMPKVPLSCTEQSDVAACNRSNDLLTRVGIHSGVLYLACLDYQHHQQQAFDETYWKKLLNSWQELTEESRTVLNPVLSEKIQQISTSTNREQQCEIVRDVIYMSY